MLSRCLYSLLFFASAVVLSSVRVMLLSRKTLSCWARSRKVWRTCFWVGFFLLWHLVAGHCRSVGFVVGGLGVGSVNVANAAYLLEEVLLSLEVLITLLAVHFVILFPCTLIHFSLFAPGPRHSLPLFLSAELLLSVLLSSNALLARPPMSDENCSLRLKGVRISLHRVFGLHPLYFLL